MSNLTIGPHGQPTVSLSLASQRAHSSSIVSTRSLFSSFSLLRLTMGVGGASSTPRHQPKNRLNMLLTLFDIYGEPSAVMSLSSALTSSRVMLATSLPSHSGSNLFSYA